MLKTSKTKKISTIYRLHEREAEDGFSFKAGGVVTRDQTPTRTVGVHLNIIHLNTKTHHDYWIHVDVRMCGDCDV